MRLKKHPRVRPGWGVVAIGQYSSLRKLMRAARCKKIPDERMVIIQMAERKAERRKHVYA